MAWLRSAGAATKPPLAGLAIKGERQDYSNGSHASQARAQSDIRTPPPSAAKNLNSTGSKHFKQNF
jgi:hypothetical protein